VTLLKSEMSLAEVARTVGVSREAVRLWRKALDDGGAFRLVAPPQEPQGRPPRLSPKQQRMFIAKLMRTARAAGFETDRWSTDDVRKLLEADFKAVYSARGVRELLTRFGFCFDPEDGWRPAEQAVGGRAVPQAARESKTSGVWTLEKRALVIAIHMEESGFPLREITAFFRECGIVQRDGRPIRETDIRKLLGRGLRPN
jgi:transposase